MAPKDGKPRAGWLARIVLLGFSLALVTGVFELGLRLVGYSSLYSVYSKPSLFWQHDEEIGWIHQPGAEGTYVGPRPFPIEFESPVKINSLGLRGPEVPPKAEDELRVLFLGDSVVVGFEVAYEDTFVAVIEQRLRRRLARPVRAINGAVRGWGTDQSLLWYRRHGRALDPDVVLFFHSENDPVDNVTIHRARRPFGKPAFVLGDDGSLRVVGQPVPHFDLCSAWMLGASGEPVDVSTSTSRVACFLQTRLADRSALFGVVARTLARFPAITEGLRRLTLPTEQLEDREQTGAAPAPRMAGFPFAGTAHAAPPIADGKALTTALLLALAREVEADGAEFRLLFTKPEDIAQVDVPNLEASGVDAKLMSGQIPVPTHWKNDGHLNEAGHQLVASLVLKLPVLGGR